ncbi:hypothetical protein V8J88_04280 [Massilia sp. W12]|uniref:hypothetical protein n=1 Tax=Massilia sp. W12 TaxID=3126507 RepID=UPI0030CAC860
MQFYAFIQEAAVCLMRQEFWRFLAPVRQYKPIPVTYVVAGGESGSRQHIRLAAAKDEESSSQPEKRETSP